MINFKNFIYVLLNVFSSLFFSKLIVSQISSGSNYLILLSLIGFGLVTLCIKYLMIKIMKEKKSFFISENNLVEVLSWGVLLIGFIITN